MKNLTNSVSMRVVLTTVIAIMFTIFAQGQFQTPNPSSPILQSPVEDVRTGSTITYSLDNGNHIAGEQYRWAVLGGTITSGGTVTTSGDSSIVEFTTDAHTISVQWDDAPATAIVSTPAEIHVQKISGAACPSQIQSMELNIWNNPTAEITDVDVEICSGDATAGSITVELEGAPDNGSAEGFRVEYEYVSTDITDGLGANPNGTTGFETTNSNSLTIPLPANLISSNSTSDVTFTVNLTLMRDDFSDVDGTWTAAGGSYVVTVHPVLETGDIQSSFSLGRR